MEVGEEVWKTIIKYQLYWRTEEIQTKGTGRGKLQKAGGTTGRKGCSLSA